MLPITLAKGVVNMLNDQSISPAAELDYAPTLERVDIEDTRIVVAPGNTTSNILNRSGDRVFQRSVSVAIVALCAPNDDAKIETLIGLCQTIGDLVARNRPLFDNDDPIGVTAISVDHDPLYDPERLRGGVFLGVVTGSYTP